MTTVLIEASSPNFADEYTGSTEVVESSALGSATTARDIHVINSANRIAASTVLSGHRVLPVWIGQVLKDVRRYDRDSVLNRDTVYRLVRAITMLPPVMPKPEVGVGDDGTVALEWVFGSADIQVYLSNQPEEDAFLVDSNGDDVLEAPLFRALAKVGRVLETLASR